MKRLRTPAMHYRQLTPTQTRSEDTSHTNPNQAGQLLSATLGEQRDKFIVVYEATQGATLKEFTVTKLDPPREDTSFYFAAAKSIETALHDFHGEQRPYNVAVLPTPSDQLYVYVLPAQTKAGVYPLGHDARYLITADGGSIVEKRQLHKSILELGPGSIPKGTTPAGGVHTHVLSDVPEDTDAFHVLTRQPSQPEFIGTRAESSTKSARTEPSAKRKSKDPRFRGQLPRNRH